MDRSKKIYSLQILRALAFVGVFLSHTGITVFSGSGAWGVSVFFILSGFLFVYTKINSNLSHVGIVGNIKYATNKIRKLYILHIVTMLLAIPFCFLGDGTFSLAQFLMSLILNVCLLQEWVPLSLRSINGVSWYLSVLLFIYSVSPYILDKMRQIVFFRGKMIVCLLFLFLLQFLIGYYASFFPYNCMESIYFDTDLTHWIVYDFPLVRLIDWMIGALLGGLYYSHLRHNIMIRKDYLLYMIFAVIFMIVIENFIFVTVTFSTRSLDNLNNRWYIYSIIYTISSAGIVYFFSLVKNNSIPDNKMTSYIFCVANVSAEGFLIHSVVIRYILGVCLLLLVPKWIAQIIAVTIGFPLTLFISKHWKRFMEGKDG